MSDNDFVGTWHLVSTEFRSEDGSLVESPYGNDPQGVLMYDVHGNMAAQVSQGHRMPFAVNDRKAGNDTETRAAFESYQAYNGRYRIDEQERVVIHTVTQALLPNWVGTEQLRHYTFKDGRLILRTPPMTIGGKRVSGLLVWERAG
ncbi:MAG: lipocalin-like domain-containing protein [Burkholderiales bacterium]